MNSFWKTTLAVIVGMILYSILRLLWLVAFMAQFVNLYRTTSSVELRPNSVLVLNLNGQIEDKVINKTNFSFLSPNVKRYSLSDVIRAIEYASWDKRISGILLDERNMVADWSQLEELREAIKDFKSSAKFVIAFSDIYTQKNYYLSSVADKVYAVPTGIFLWKGLSAQILFYKNLFDKLGIKVMVFRHGKYKSAVEPYITDKISKPNREQLQHLLGVIWGHVLNDVSNSRHIPVKVLDSMASNLAVKDVADAQRYGLIDGQIYYDQMLDTLRKLMLVPGNESVNMINISDYIKAIKAPRQVTSDKVAVVYMQGMIVDASTGTLNNEIVSTRSVRLLEKLRKDPQVKAVVLRVNSPGGSAMAADEIWREIERVKQDKPVVVSMSGVAASGGYYISCGADKIVADPMTITGSIGVFGMYVNAKGLLTDKLGITTSVVQTNPNADIDPFFGQLTEAQKAYLKYNIDKVYRTFLERVAKGRNLSVADVDSIAQGRVWTGIDAYQIGLVDTLGNLQTAISIAASLANLKVYKVVEYPKPKTFLELLMENYSSMLSDTKVLGPEQSKILQRVRLLYDFAKRKEILALMPWQMNM